MLLKFHQNLRAGFLEMAKAEPHRFVVINADTDINSLHSQIVEVVNERFGLSHE